MDRINFRDLKRVSSIKVDYENIDISQVMDQIKKIAAEQAGQAVPGDLPPKDTGPSSSLEYSPGIPPEGEPAGLKQKVRGRIARLMKPFFPLIRLLALPIHEELMRTIQSLHETNRRLDYLDRKLTEKDMSMDYIKLLHNLSHNIVVELTKLKIEEETLKSKMQILAKDLEFLTKREKALEKKVFK